MFWDRFLAECTKVNIAPNKVAATLGVSSASVTKWKNGTIPHGDVLLKISQYFGCSIDYLLGNDDYHDLSRYTAEQEAAMLKDDDAKQMLAGYLSLPAAERESIRSLIQALAGRTEQPKSV